MTRARVWIAVLMLALAVPVGVRAWGQQGHRLVGLLAASRLTPLAQQNVGWLLDGQTMAEVSSWADRNNDGHYQTSWWHFINIPPDATAYDRDRDCPRQPGAAVGSRPDRWRDCIIDRILFHRERIADPTLDRADRSVSLKFLVHFVGDLHQPYHALGVERGGNGIVVTSFGSDQCGIAPQTYPCNLHAVWDTSLVARRQLADAEYVAHLNALIAAERLEAQPTHGPAEWAMESHALAKAALLPQGADADQAYYERHIATVDRRLAQAGVRLAALINDALTTPPPGK